MNYIYYSLLALLALSLLPVVIYVTTKFIVIAYFRGKQEAEKLKTDGKAHFFI